MEENLKVFLKWKTTSIFFEQPQTRMMQQKTIENKDNSCGSAPVT
jgi:hypothetical protein